MKNKLIYLLLGISFMFLISACGRKEEETLEKGEYYIYYLNSSGTELSKVKYEAQSAERDELIDELVTEMMNVPGDKEVVSALDDKVAYERHELREDVVYLYFDSNYSLMKPYKEILTRKAIANTLERVKGIKFIGIYVDEQPLVDISGEVVPLFSSSDFIDGITNVNAYQKVKLKLYFASESGEGLVEEDRSLFYDINTPLEKLVLEQLIQGPNSKNAKATIPADTGIINTYIDENICYINFDDAFLKQNLGVREDVAIYSIVNSILEINTINKVKILVNGSSNVMYRDMLNLDTVFERNLDYLEKD